jgi:anaerobic selenocysteine-containing dehydrogenase
MTDRRIVHRICTLCEATCGITVEAVGDRIVTIRGDNDDPFSKGYICPKAYGLKGLHEDPDRIRQPIRKKADGSWDEISWDEAYAHVGARLLAIRERYGANAIATYLGNPSAHSLHTMIYLPVFNRALGTKQRFSASTVDQFPKMMTSALMFGDELTIPVPDLDRTDYLMILGGNPLASNGSLMTAPNVRGRLKAIKERGGKVVVLDPRRSETARIASEHHFIRPGTDTYLLLAMLHVMLAEGLARFGRTEGHLKGLDEVQALITHFSPQAVTMRCGIPAGTIQRLARELCAAERAACYGRTGTTCQQFGTLASWAVDLVNICSGNLDRPGGAMFARAAAAVDATPHPKGARLHRWQSRVRGLPEVLGELPVATLADEIETPGEGQIRAVVTVAGNPVVSTPNAGRLDRALESLDFMVSIDFYVNETTRHAHVILPPTDALEHDTYDLALYRLAVRDVAKYSQPVFDKPAGAQHDWEILAVLSAYLMGMGRLEPKAVDDFLVQQMVNKVLPSVEGRWSELAPLEAIEKLGDGPGPHRTLDLLLRTGPYGDGFGRNRDGLNLQKLKDNPHGVDLGPLKEQLPGVVRTPSGKIELTPEPIVADLERLRVELATPEPEMVLIGRRHLRSNNSWCHNVEALVKGPERCTLLLSTEDAKRLHIHSGERARVTSRVGSVVAPVEVSDEMMPGVVSLPHGWGHDVDGVRMAVARAHPGVNSNILTDEDAIDVPSGNAVLNGIPVNVVRLSDAGDGVKT